PRRSPTIIDYTVTFYHQGPSVTINQVAAKSNPTNAGLILFTVAFSEAVTGFTPADVSFAGSTAPGTLVAAVSGSGTTYTVSVSGMTGPGTFVATVLTGAVTDAAGNPSAAHTNLDNNVTFNNV